MKKIIIMLVLALFVTIFAGCNAAAKNPDLDSEINSNILLGRAAGEAAGLDMDNPPTWEEIQEMRKSSDCECFWASRGVLHTKVAGETADLTPDEALQRYGDNPEFVKEYIFLMSYTDFPAPATIVDKDGDLQNLSYDPPGEEWEGPSD